MVQCCIVGCKSRSERKHENITFHTYPKEAHLRHMWIISTGRHDWEPTKHSRICSRHFENRCFRKTQRMTYLYEFSVPTLYIYNNPPTDMPSTLEGILSTAAVTRESTSHNVLNTEVNVMPVLRSAGTGCRSFNKPLTDIPSTPVGIPSTAAGTQVSTLHNVPVSESDSLTPRKKRLVRRLMQKSALAETRKRKLAVARAKYSRLKKKNAELSTILENLKSQSLINEETAEMLTSVYPNDPGNFLKPNVNQKYSPEVRKFALNLHFISPRAYSFVRQTFNTCLPHPRTLARWYEGIHGEPGFSTESLEALKLLAKQKTDKIIGALTFDEMAIRRSVVWDGQRYVGFVNCGEQLENEILPIAKDALVFMVTCINGAWKLPVGYFLIDGVTAEQKYNLLKNCLDLINGCGVEIASVTFDGCPANLSMLKLLGCKLGTVINPVFTHNGNKIVAFPDPSHMLKLIRNTLGDKNDLIDPEGHLISWKFIKDLVNLQENENFHLANKLRGAHVNFKKQIMKVKLAAQIFSESVADALEFCDKQLELPQFKNCDATVKFIRKINLMFDLLNSRNLNAYGFKKPLSKDNSESVHTFIKDTFAYISNIKLNGIPVTISNRKTGFLGFLMCLKSIEFLYEKYIITNSLKFLCTYKMSQDHLEIFFGAIRAKGGFNNNPTAVQFKSAYKRMLIHGELKHLTGNCIPLSDINILIYSKPETALNKITDRGRLIDEESQIPITDVVISKDHDYLTDPNRLTEFSRSVITYIAGFVVKTVKKEITCIQCAEALDSTDRLTDSLIFKKDKGGLQYPSKSVISICQIAEQTYRQNVCYNKKDPLHYLIAQCLKKCIGMQLFSDLSTHFVNQPIEENHYSLLIKIISKKYLNVRIHYCTKKILDKQEKIRNLYTKLILFKGQ